MQSLSDFALQYNLVSETSLLLDDLKNMAQPVTSGGVEFSHRSSMRERLVNAVSEIRKRYPDLDPDTESYIEGIIIENGEYFESIEEVYEAVGGFLEVLGGNRDAHRCCIDVYNIIHPNGYIDSRERLHEPVHMTALVNSFNERVMDAASIWVAKREISSTVDPAKLAKAEARSREKQSKKPQDNKVSSLRTNVCNLESACVTQRQGKKDRLSTTGAIKITDLHIKDFDISFGKRVILQNANLHLSFGHRYGLVGRNGSGKTTLLRALASGDLRLPPGLTVLHVEQEVMGDNTPAIESVLQADTQRATLMAELAKLRAGKESDEASSRLVQIFDQLSTIDADSASARAASILHGLGVEAQKQDCPTREFSGGWRMRLALARALFAKPDLLLLDEPTNMLDMRAMIWLENYLLTWKGIMVVVSHDQAFLNAIATDIIHLVANRLDAYRGDYDAFVKARDERLLNEEREYLAQKAERDHIQQFIDTFRYNAKRASLVQSRIKALERMPKLVPPEKPIKVIFKLPECEKIALQPLVQLEGVHFHYLSETPLLEDVDLTVLYNSRICVVGENGAGKTTLLRLLLGDLKPVKGLRHCHRSLRMAYFSQHHVDQLDLDVSSLEFLTKKFPGEAERCYRSQLASFEIDPLLAQQPIGSLSGGQKSRVAFAALCMLRPNLLILDEPTNHLDIETIDALAESLKNFGGGVVLVSHDERLIASVCTECWASRVSVLTGGLEEYKKAVRRELEAGEIIR
ncbi:ATP-binding cassette sub-family F member 3 [Taenia crassiceps]|uniref:ATP-binding cassette sub-family F member 3 n=1 Tax=Taenia crassiceps TaxID=6207 RepID=A0ABR4QFM4_9CEST